LSEDLISLPQTASRKMLGRSLRARIYLLLVEYTSIPLLAGLYLLYLSGYGLTRASVEKLTLGLLTRHNSILIHTGIPPYVVGLLAALHALGGFGLMICRRVRSPRLSLALELLNLILVGMLFPIQLTILAFPGAA